MTYPDPQLLAAADDAANLIFTIIVAAIAGVGALVSAAKKKQNDQARQIQHRDNWERIEREMRERAAMATRALSGQAEGYSPPPPPPPLPMRTGAANYPTPPLPQPVFAPTRSIEAAYVPPRPPPRRQVPTRPVPVPPRPVQVQKPLNRPQVRRLKKQKSGRLPPAPPMAPAAALPPELPTAARAVEAPPVPRDARPAAPANASAVSRWLTAKTLRSQFILTEILQPPVALRDRAPWD